MSALCTTRLETFRKALTDAGLTHFFMRSESDIRWITGFDGVFDGEGAFALLVTPRQAILHTDSRYELATRTAAAESPITVDTTRASHASVAASVLAEENDVSAAQPSKPQVKLGVETSLTLGEYRALEHAMREKASDCAASDAVASAAVVSALPACEFVEIEGLCVKLRGVKDASEIARMRAAQAITDAAFSHIVGFMRPGMTERQVQVELEDYMVRHGACGLAFSSIVACGEHGASPHAIPDDTKLQAGQCVVLDFGARAQGYCSDMTRVVFLGEPSAEMRHAYAVLREANETVEALLAPGITGAQAHAKAEEVLAAGGFAGKMGHGLGHGVGLDIHEQPNLSPRNTLPLVAGNVVTVEPGIYLEGRFGMRLEDFGVITETGFQVFTQSSHEMVII